MDPDQDAHRDKRLKASEEIGGSSTSSTTPSTSRPDAQPGTPSIPLDPLSTSSHFNNIHPLAVPPNHPSGRRANGGLNNDNLDLSASKGKGTALPVRERTNRALETIYEDAEMGDVDEETPAKSDHPKVKDDGIDSSASKGKGRALSTPETSETEESSSDDDRNNGSAKDDDMDNYDDEHSNGEDRDQEEDGEEDEEDDSSGSVASAAMGGHGILVQIPLVEQDDPPLAEVHPGEDRIFDEPEES